MQFHRSSVRCRFVSVVSAFWFLGLMGVMAQTPPVITCSTNIVAECTGGLTPVSFVTTAFDGANSVSVICTPPSGSGFRLGASNVVCTATNSVGQSSSCTFTVTVVDTTPPQVFCNTNRTLAATSAAGAVATYISSASDVCGIASFNCSPPSGLTFPVGVTEVLCRARDSVGNSNGCIFTITVTNQCPVANLLSVNVDHDAQVNFQLPATDPEGDALQFSITDAPSHGIVVLQVQTGATSYSPSPGYCGPDSFKYKVTDGMCESAEATVSISVTCAPTNHCPIASPVSITVTQGSQVNFQLQGTDPDSDPLQFNISQGPAHGTVVLQVQTGAASYSPAAGYCGPDSFKYRVTDGVCQSAEATVSIDVQCTNSQPPVCVAQISCGPTVIALNGSNACVILDASASTDPENDPLAFRWVLNEPIEGATVTNCFDLGCHPVVLEVSDGQTVSRCETNVCVITASEAVEQCIALVDSSDLGRRNKVPLIVSLNAASASFNRGNFVPALNSLEAFQKKVAAQIALRYPTEAAAMINCAQRIVDALKCSAVVSLDAIGGGESPENDR
jgi:hypothetical protein